MFQLITYDCSTKGGIFILKVLGLTCGRKMGNSEVLVREALMGAQEVSDAEIEIIRLHDLTIKPCIGCENCNYERLLGTGDGECFIKDDHFPFLLDKIINCDGMILGAPCYHSRPPGLLLMIQDRFMGVSVTDRKRAVERPKARGDIAVAGTDTEGIMLPLLNRCLSIRKTKLVDRMLVIFTSRPAQVVLNEEAIARARRLGCNVGQAIKMPFDKVNYVGDKFKSLDDLTYRSDYDLNSQLRTLYEACPVCKSDLVRLRGKNVECPTCYIKGTIEVKDGVVNFICDPVNRPSLAYTHQRHNLEGILMHNKLIQWRKQEISEKMKKYTSHIPATLIPSLKQSDK